MEKKNFKKIKLGPSPAVSRPLSRSRTHSMPDRPVSFWAWPQHRHRLRFSIEILRFCYCDCAACSALPHTHTSKGENAILECLQEIHITTKSKKLHL